MKRILVTGGAGFLGSHLCERLLERGNFVTCLDNYFTGAVDNIAHLRGHNNFATIEQSVIDPVDVRFEEIFNLACPASPVHYQSDPIYTFKTSIIGTMNLLELASKTGAKVLQASTSEIYGDPLIHPQTEAYWGNVNTMGIRSCYDEGKRGAETLMHDYHRTRGVNIRVMRIFNTYGPGMNKADGRVVSNFIVQALRGDDITMFGDGLQTRSFCYRDDLVEGMMRLMDAPDEVSYPVNIGNPGEFTMRELAELVLELTGSKSKIVYLPLPQDDPMQRCPDISRAKEVLGWEPTVPLREGLKRTIDYFKTVV
ncbi:UDP-glucuronic acid decarboxylase family protein [Rhizobium sp. TRM95796]|uniref:UDP-glucuronic acid decarboxylase family protein n=1 Tax=Rhizobium sp. TRM95796 TaxID=2979862 RepID=UPI0021E7826D|nr:UDP-glucuronic acid decarboxylase family protein [Rhizobium sp. TRM95796]MCV3766008.1 SDR family oxidoreductase [Rhizobium sp. TRM95796]